jgi:hypothetical protein
VDTLSSFSALTWHTHSHHNHRNQKTTVNTQQPDHRSVSPPPHNLHFKFSKQNKQNKTYYKTFANASRVSRTSAQVTKRPDKKNKFDMTEPQQRSRLHIQVPGSSPSSNEKQSDEGGGSPSHSLRSPRKFYFKDNNMGNSRSSPGSRQRQNSEIEECKEEESPRGARKGVKFASPQDQSSMSKPPPSPVVPTPVSAKPPTPTASMKKEWRYVLLLTTFHSGLLLLFECIMNDKLVTLIFLQIGSDISCEMFPCFESMASIKNSPAVGFRNMVACLKESKV